MNRRSKEKIEIIQSAEKYGLRALLENWIDNLDFKKTARLYEDIDAIGTISEGYDQYVLYDRSRSNSADIDKYAVKAKMTDLYIADRYPKYEKADLVYEKMDLYKIRRDIFHYTRLFAHFNEWNLSKEIRQLKGLYN